MALRGHEAFVQLVDIGINRLDYRRIHIGAGLHLNRVFLTGGHYQFRTHRARHSGNNHALAETVTQGGDETDEILVSTEDHECIDIGPHKRGIDDIHRHVEIASAGVAFAAAGVGNALGGVVERLEAGYIQPCANRFGVLIEIGVGARHGHQPVLHCHIAPLQWIWLAAK